MTNRWKDDSEVLAGLALYEKVDPNAVNLNALYPPYDVIVKYKREGLDATGMLSKGVPFTELNGAMLAGEKIEAQLGIDYLKWVETDASRALGGARLRKQAEKLERGDEPDIGIILQVASNLDEGYKEMTPMSDVSPAGNMFVKTGYAPFDEHFGGVPKSSMTILAASPGVGKTTLALKVAASCAKRYKEKYVAFYSLEMQMSQLTQRALEIDTSLTEEDRSRILLNDEIMPAEDVYALASRTAAKYPLSMILVDFADQMADGKQDESVMGQIYKTMAALAKRTGVPVLLISQLNRETYSGGIPKINHIRYSGLAEAMAAMILLVYNPHNIFVDSKSNSVLPSVPGCGYVIIGKSRYGYVHGGPGAVQIGWDGLGGWDDEAVGIGWHTLGG